MTSPSSDGRRSEDWQALRYILRKGWLRAGQYREALEFGEKAAKLERKRVRTGA